MEIGLIYVSLIFGLRNTAKIHTLLMATLFLLKLRPILRIPVLSAPVGVIFAQMEHSVLKTKVLSMENNSQK